MAAPDSRQQTRYRGRFAPSPTGPLHAGSLLTAVASFLDARSQQGEWLLRIEDLDPPRESRAAADDILQALDALGLHWDGPVLYQSTRHAAYDAALERLWQAGLVYACDCSRRELATQGPVYLGHCRHRALAPGPERSLRCRAADYPITCHDRLQGDYSQRLAADVGDFVIHRRDGYYAYQLAVVVDDGWQGITDVVRGLDLLDSTPRQLHLQRCLELPTPRYAHLPLIVDRSGQKLSKQQHARPIDYLHPVPALLQALRYLGLQPEPGLEQSDPATILNWGRHHWKPETLRKIRQLPDETT